MAQVLSLLEVGATLLSTTVGLWLLWTMGARNGVVLFFYSLMKTAWSATQSTGDEDVFFLFFVPKCLGL